MEDAKYKETIKTVLINSINNERVKYNLGSLGRFPDPVSPNTTRALHTCVENCPKYIRCMALTIGLVRVCDGEEVHATHKYLAVDEEWYDVCDTHHAEVKADGLPTEKIEAIEEIEIE